MSSILFCFQITLLSSSHQHHLYPSQHSYFQDLALDTLDNLYEFNRDEAYASLVSVLPFKWGKYVTPLTIADDGEAMRFMGHACCQTFLHLVWLQYMDLDTAYWKVRICDLHCYAGISLSVAAVGILTRFCLVGDARTFGNQTPPCPCVVPISMTQPRPACPDAFLMSSIMNDTTDSNITWYIWFLHLWNKQTNKQTTTNLNHPRFLVFAAISTVGRGAFCKPSLHCFRQEEPLLWFLQGKISQGGRGVKAGRRYRTWACHEHASPTTGRHSGRWRQHPESRANWAMVLWAVTKRRGSGAGSWSLLGSVWKATTPAPVNKFLFNLVLNTETLVVVVVWVFFWGGMHLSSASPSSPNSSFLQYSTEEFVIVTTFFCRCHTWSSLACLHIFFWLSWRQ